MSALQKRSDCRSPVLAGRVAVLGDHCHDEMESGRLEQRELVETRNDNSSVIFWKLDRNLAGAIMQSKGVPKDEER
jgi:hypothetical protein